MSQFKPFYEDGRTIMIGDYVEMDNWEVRVILELLQPDDPTCIELGFKHGAVAYTPASLTGLPLSSGLTFLRRCENGEAINDPR